MPTPRKFVDMPAAGASPLRGLRTFTPRKQVGATSAFRAGSAAGAAAVAALAVPRAQTSLATVGPRELSDVFDHGRDEITDAVKSILEQIQAHVFQRRIRLKERFHDFDPLRSGRCTEQQFIRAVNALAPNISQEDAEELSVRYIDSRLPRQPQVVNYHRFCREVDEVFTLWELEKDPVIQVPRPGASMQRYAVGAASPSVGLGGMNPEVEEVFFNNLLTRIALMAKTRGTVFRTCFQDCERADATSLTTPRYSGKVTAAQFLQHFPFIKDFTSEEVDLLLKRYSTGGDVHYLALDKDVAGVKLEAEVALPHNAWRQQGCGYISGSPCARATPHSTRRPLTAEDTAAPVVMGKLKAVIAERRLRMRDLFQDFDRLRRGVCGMHQLGTVFTVLHIELDPKELASLADLYCDSQGMFRYRIFVEDIAQVPLNLSSPESTLQEAELQSALSVPSSSPLGSRERQRAMLGSSNQATLDDVEVIIRKQVALRSLPLKGTFGDFDRVRSGRVTRTQFARILDMLDIRLSEREVELLCEAYCDPDTRWEFKYLDFCAAVDIRMHGMGAWDTKRPSKYFTRGGQVVPHPLLVPRPCTR